MDRSSLSAAKSMSSSHSAADRKACRYVKAMSFAGMGIGEGCAVQRASTLLLMMRIEVLEAEEELESESKVELVAAGLSKEAGSSHATTTVAAMCCLSFAAVSRISRWYCASPSSSSSLASSASSLPAVEAAAAAHASC